MSRPEPTGAPGAMPGRAGCGNPQSRRHRWPAIHNLPAGRQVRNGQWLLVVFLACVLTGCARWNFDILVEPGEGGVDREITIRREGAVRIECNDQGTTEVHWGCDYGKVERIAKLYDTPVPPEEGPATQPGAAASQPARPEPITFRKTFQGTTPGDVGGAGFYYRIETTLGSAHLYVERSPGCGDQAAKLQKAFAATDKAVDTFARWLKAQLGGDADWPKLERFVGTVLRDDLKNLVLLAWTCRNAPRMFGSAASQAGQTITKDLAARVLGYLVESNYLLASDLPEAYRMLADGTRALAPSVKSIIRRALAAKAGIGSEAIHGFFAAAMDNPEAALASIQSWDDKDPAVRQAARNWRQMPPPANEPAPAQNGEPSRVATALLAAEALLLGRCCLIEALCPPDQVRLRLRTGTQPLYTSGEWDVQTGLVTWSGPIRTEVLPVVCYALWCRPDGKFQKAHFGRTVLTGNDLGAYCLWRKSLTADEGRRWEEFLASCRPGRDSPKRIRDFRFAPPAGPRKPEEPQGKDYGQTGADILLRAMGQER